MAKFDMAKVFNTASMEGALSSLELGNIINIEIDKIRANNSNFYDTENIQWLVASIEQNGLFDNLVVIDNEDGTYLLTSGHRRLKACKTLYDNGDKRFEKVPCKVYKCTSDAEKEFLLLEGNKHNRIKSSYEQMQELNRYKQVYERLKEQGYKFKGKIRDLLAEQMGISPAQVQRFTNVSQNLIPEAKQELKDNKINFTEATELAKKEPEQQRENLTKLVSEKNKQESEEQKQNAKSVEKSAYDIENITATFAGEVYTLELASDNVEMTDDDYELFKSHINKMSVELRKAIALLETNRK